MVKAMKRTQFLIRATVISSSVLLASGFVAYRAGAFDRVVNRARLMTGQKHPELMSSSKSKVISLQEWVPLPPEGWTQSPESALTLPVNTVTPPPIPSEPPAPSVSGESKPLQLMSSTKGMVIAPAITKPTTGQASSPPK